MRGHMVIFEVPDGLWAHLQPLLPAQGSDRSPPTPRRRDLASAGLPRLCPRSGPHRDRGHSRIELRTLKAVTVHHFGFPHAAQVLQVTRKTRQLRTWRWRTVTVYAITSLTAQQASPARLADLLRGHWTIESLHHLRDTTFAEDASQVRTGAAPTSWRACATWSSGCSVGRGRSTSPPRCAATPATHADPSPHSGSASDDPDITTERRSPEAPCGPAVLRPASA
jgi:Transposase DDE domain